MQGISRSWFAVSATGEAFAHDEQWVRHSSGVLIGIGVVMTILGVVALMNTFVATLATVFAVGLYLVAGGIMNAVDAFMIRRWNLALLDVLAAVLYFVAAWFTLRSPIAAADTITVVLAAFFMVSGLVRFIGALAMQPAHWGWLMVHGLVTFLLGLVLFVGLPVTGLTGPGLLIGIDLLFSGISATALGVATRRTTGSRHQGERGDRRLPAAPI